jgi:hypothetical protein
MQFAITVKSIAVTTIPQCKIAAAVFHPAEFSRQNFLSLSLSSSRIPCLVPTGDAARSRGRHTLRVEIAGTKGRVREALYDPEYLPGIKH